MSAAAASTTAWIAGRPRALRARYAAVMAGLSMMAARALPSGVWANFSKCWAIYVTSWNERVWADGGPIDPSPTIDQAINGGYAWLQIECSRCKAARDVDLAALPRPTTTAVHDLAGRLR